MWDRPQLEPEDRPPCEECDLPWMVPRPVVYKLSPYVPKHVPPTTTDAVIAYQSVDQTCRPHFPEQVFNTIQYTTSSGSCCRFPSKHRLVKDFRYHSVTGEVFDGNSGEGDKYARLVTLNSWYYRLAHTLLFVSFSVVDLQTNFLLVVRTFYDPELSGHEELQMVWPWLITAYGLMLLACLSLSFSEATRDWAVNSNPKKGDLILGLHWLDTWGTFSAMMLFSFFSVEGMVTDIVVLLHPWKGIQPYAAIKLHNARAYSIGWGTRPMWAVENKPNATRSLPAQIITKTYVFALKLYMCYLFPSRFDVIAAAVSSVPSLLMSYRKFLVLRNDRHKLKHYLVGKLTNPALEKGPEKDALEKILFRLFGEMVDEAGKILKQDNDSFWRDGLEKEGRCTTCGRLARPHSREDGGCEAECEPLEMKEKKSHNGNNCWDKRGELQVCGHAAWKPVAKLTVEEPERKGKFGRSATTMLENELEPDRVATLTMPGSCWKIVRENEDSGRDFAMIFGQVNLPQCLREAAQCEMSTKSTSVVTPEDSWPVFPAFSSKAPSSSPHPIAVRMEPRTTPWPHPIAVRMEDALAEEPAPPDECHIGVLPAQPNPGLDDMVHCCLDAGPSPANTPEERAVDLRAAGSGFCEPDPRGGVG